MLLRKKSLLCFSLMYALTSGAYANEVNERLDMMDDSIFRLEEKVGGEKTLARAFNAKDFNFGGFIHTAYTHIHAPDRTINGFNRQVFELLLSGNMNDYWSFFFAGGFLRESDGAFDNVAGGTRFAPAFNHRNKNPQIIGWVNYQYNDLIGVRIGRMITPHGVINIQHFPAILLETEQPMFLRPFSGSTIFPNFTTGIQLHGVFDISRKLGGIKYAGYVTNINGAATSLINEKHISGVRVAWNTMSNALEFGLNYSHGARDTVNLDHYSMRGVDLMFQKYNITLKAELFETTETDSVNRKGYYIQPAYKINPKWYVFYRYDYLDLGTTSSSRDRENVIGINFLPIQSIRLRLNYTHKKFGQTRDLSLAKSNVNRVQISGTFNF